MTGGWDSWEGTEAWRGLGNSSAVTPARPAGTQLSPSSRSVCQGQREGFFPVAPSRSRESLLRTKFCCWLESRPVKLEMNSCCPGVALLLTGTVAKPHLRGNVCAWQGVQAGGEAVTGAVLGLLGCYWSGKGALGPVSQIQRCLFLLLCQSPGHCAVKPQGRSRREYCRASGLGEDDPNYSMIR